MATRRRQYSPVTVVLTFGAISCGDLVLELGSCCGLKRSQLRIAPPKDSLKRYGSFRQEPKDSAVDP